MRSKFPCCVCRTKSANSGFVCSGTREKCLCRPCYAQQLRESLQTFGVGVNVETQTELDTVVCEGGMYFKTGLFVFVLFVSNMIGFIDRKFSFQKQVVKVHKVPT
jgi:hypothetical protein